MAAETLNAVYFHTLMVWLKSENDFSFSRDIFAKIDLLFDRHRRLIIMMAIEVEKLTKEFNGFVAVDHISFSIRSGEVFGLLGPNGAGKTTTMSMLSTMLKPTSGKASVNGFDILKKEDDVRKSIGIVFQDQSLDEELTAYENMDFHGRLYRIPKDLRENRT